MPTVCLHCSLRALVAYLPAPSFDESPEAHVARCHPDLAATEAERGELLRALAARLGEPSRPSDPDEGDEEGEP